MAMTTRKKGTALGLTMVYLLMIVGVPVGCNLLGDSSLWAGQPDSTEYAVTVEQPQQTLPETRTTSLQSGDTARLWDASEEKLLTLTMTEYLIGATASEMPQSYPDEAIKAQIIAVHSYYEYCRQHKIFDLEREAVLQVDTAAYEGYLTPAQRTQVWGEAAQENAARLQNLVEQVQSQLVTYQGTVADTCYHAFSVGSTAAAQDVWGEEIPYLVSVDSHWDTDAQGYAQVTQVSYQQMSDILTTRFLGVELHGSPTQWFTAEERTPQGYVTWVQVGGVWLKALDLRSFLGLHSTNYELTVADGNFTFATKGYGHGVGMSQYGAGCMAQEGNSCARILAHYYPGTKIEQADEVLQM